MTRLALADKWSGWTTPRHRWVRTLPAPVSNAPRGCDSSSEARAMAPRPEPERPRNARRVMWSLSRSFRSMISTPHNCLVQVQNHPGYRSPGGEFGPVHVPEHGPVSDAQHIVGGLFVGLVLLQVLLVQTLQQFHLLRPGLAA